jgi:hypothetical protein
MIRVLGFDSRRGLGIFLFTTASRILNLIVGVEAECLFSLSVSRSGGRLEKTI